MTYHGHVRKGRIELDEPTALPEGAEVELSIVREGKSEGNGRNEPVEPREGQHTPSIEEEIDRIWADVPESEWAKLPADLSDQIDHYVYGTPKK